MLLNGEGQQVTATDTTAIWTISKTAANSLSVQSVYAEASTAVYVLVNCTIAEFDVLYAANKAIRIQSGLAFSFNGDGRFPITSVCYRTASGTCDIDFAAF